MNRTIRVRDGNRRLAVYFLDNTPLETWLPAGEYRVVSHCLLSTTGERVLKVIAASKHPWTLYIRRRSLAVGVR